MDIVYLVGEIVISKQFVFFLFFFKAHRLLPRRAETYSMRVGAIGPKLDGHRTEDAKLTRHLVHSAQGPLLISVCKFDHQAGRGALGGTCTCKRLVDVT